MRKASPRTTQKELLQNKSFERRINLFIKTNGNEKCIGGSQTQVSYKFHPDYTSVQKLKQHL